MERIVTDKILNYDKVTCDRILQSILEEKQMEDHRRQCVQRNRQEQRSRLSQRHNEVMRLEQQCGVRLGMNLQQEPGAIG